MFTTPEVKPIACAAALLLGAVAALQPASRQQILPPLFAQTRELQVVAADAAPPSLRIISWNIDRGTALSRITDELKSSPADLCLLQEVDWGTTRTRNADIGETLARSLHLNMSYGVEFEELSQEVQQQAYTGQATLTNLPIERSRILRFERQSDCWMPRRFIPTKRPWFQRRVGNRIALVTELQYRGRPLVVYNTHLESHSFGRLQLDQLTEILNDLNTRYSLNTPAIIAGDLNSKFIPRVFLHKLERDGFHSAFGEKIRSTASVLPLDWIFVRGPYQFEGGQVRKDLKGSDHYPVFAELIATHP